VNPFLVGLALGLFVAAQPGPVSFLLLRTAARGRRLPAFMIGLAAACIDATYAALGAAGVAPLLQWGPARIGFGLLGGAVLVVIGTRTLWSAWRVRSGLETADDVTSPGRAFATGFAATASNPLTIASWAAIFAAASVSGTADSLAGAIALVAGIGVASLSWFTALTMVSAVMLRRIGSGWIGLVDAVCGVGLVACGVLFGVRSVAAES
jgi:threonine/homoserine/homoserine lactone efflux protein